VIIMRVLDDPEPWVAQCVDFADFDAEELKEMLGPDAEDEEANDDDDDDEVFREVDCMRAAFRWLNRPQDVRAELTNVQGHPREVFMTDYLAPLHYNSVGVIDDVVVVKPSLGELLSAGADAELGYFCNRFFWTEAAKNSPPLHGKLAKSGERLRGLRPGELEMILNKPTLRDTLFWRVVNPRPAARKSFSGALAMQISTTPPPQRRVDTTEDNVSASRDVSGAISASAVFHEKIASPKASENRALRQAAEVENVEGGSTSERVQTVRANEAAASDSGEIQGDAAMPDRNERVDEAAHATAMKISRQTESAAALSKLAAPGQELEVEGGAANWQEAIVHELPSDDDSLTRPAVSSRTEAMPEHPGILLEMLVPASEISKIDGAIRALAPEQRSSFASCLALILRKSKDRLAQVRQDASFSGLEQANTAVVEEMARHARVLLSSAEAARRAVQ
jgi:hypothetical protein